MNSTDETTERCPQPEPEGPDDAFRDTKTHPPRRRAAWYLTVTGVLLIAAAVGLAGFGGFARDSFTVGPARVSVSAWPALRPTTTIGVPPFGQIRADTHATPLALLVSLDEVDIGALEQLAMSGIPDSSTIDAMVSDVRTGFVRAVLKGFIAALLGGLFVGWSLRRSRRATIASGLVAALVPALLVAATSLTYDMRGFRTPEFRGAVRYAPSLISLVQGRIERVESLRAQVTKLSADLARYYAAPQSFPASGDLRNTYRVLHVTDIHLDPVGLKLSQELAKQYGVALVVDTGDINDYGSTVEGRVIASQLPTSPPRYYVPGNHDSPATIASLAGVPGVTIASTTATEVAGIRVFGVPDPGARGFALTPANERILSVAREAAAGLRSAIASGEPTPTIVAVHNPLMVGAFEGLTPLILAGHTHTAALARRGDSWYLNSGTTGGVDFSNVQAQPHIPHTASIIYFTPGEPHRLIAIDQIEVFGLAGESSLKRTVIDETLLP